MKFFAPSFVLMIALLTGQASAQIAPLPHFGYLPWCAGSNTFVDQANEMLTKNQSQLSVKLPTTFRLITLGDKYAECARSLSGVQANSTQQPTQMAYIMDALELSTEAHFAAARSAADIIDLSPPAKRSADERYLFATAAHDTLLYTSLLKSNSAKPDQIARTADIQSSIAELVPVYGSDQLGVIYQGLPK